MVPTNTGRLPVGSPAANSRRTTAALVILGFVVATLTVVVVRKEWILFSVRGQTPPIAARTHEPHRLLITEFENSTGEPAVVRRLRDALQEQLAASRFADVVSADQVAEFLQLMKKPATTPVDMTVGREIALRDGTIDAFVTGSVERIDSIYVASVRIQTPHNSNLVASFRSQAPGPWQLSDAVRREMAGVQSKLDEHLGHDQKRPEVATVTTSSLRALQLYCQVVDLMDQVPMKTAPAFELLTEAIKLDSEFASAHILAAWTLRNAGRNKDAFLPYAERAFQLADTTSGAERYFILGSYHQLKLDFDKAVSAYEALLRLNPKHYWALGNLGRLYRATGRHAATAQLRARQIEIRPHQFWGNYRLAEALLLNGDMKRARQYAASAVSLVSQLDSGDMQARLSWFEILPACEAWLRDDGAEATRIAQNLEETLTRRAGADRETLTTSLGYTYLALGHRRAAERMFRALPKSESRLYQLAVVASRYGMSEQANGYFAALNDFADPPALVVGLPAMDARLLPRADELVTNWEKELDEADANLLRGQLALMRGRVATAIPLLARSIELREDRFGSPALAASEGLARAWASSGDREQAIHVLEEASQNRFRSCLWPMANAHLWVRVRADLAHLYRQVGRTPEAQAVETQLRTLLQSADRDHPFMAQLGAVANEPPVSRGGALERR